MVNEYINIVLEMNKIIHEILWVFQYNRNKMVYGINIILVKIVLSNHNEE